MMAISYKPTTGWVKVVWIEIPEKKPEELPQQEIVRF